LGDVVDMREKRSFYKISEGNLFTEEHLMDVNIDEMKEIVIRLEGEAGLEGRSVGRSCCCECITEIVD
jgi:hypothetical protein